MVNSQHGPDNAFCDKPSCGDHRSVTQCYDYGFQTGRGLAAFTCELYLKCVIYYQTGKRATGHDIGNLFDQLNDGTRKLLKEKLERVEIIVKEDFSAEIEDASKAFSKWRYLYEGAPRGFINSRLLESISVLLNYYIEGEEVEWPLRYVASVKDDCI